MTISIMDTTLQKELWLAPSRQHSKLSFLQAVLLFQVLPPKEEEATTKMSVLNNKRINFVHKVQ